MMTFVGHGFECVSRDTVVNKISIEHAASRVHFDLIDMETRRWECVDLKMPIIKTHRHLLSVSNGFFIWMLHAPSVLNR